jgi:hypothetical protein
MICTSALVALAALTGLLQTPEEAKGLKVLWVPSALAGTSNTDPGFEFLHPATQVVVRVTKGKEFKPILDSMPVKMKSNGIWISTSNSFLYSEEENAELKVLVQLGKTQKIPVFICQLMSQPEGWKKLDD